MSTLGPVRLLIMALVVSACFVSLGAIPALLARNFISKRPAWTGVRTWLLYPLIATFVIACVVGTFLYANIKGIDDYTTIKSMNITITAAFVFGYALKRFWLLRKKWTFWTGLGVLIAGHFVLLSRLHWQRPSYFWLPVVVGAPELALVIFVFGLTFDPHGNVTEQDPP